MEYGDADEKLLTDIDTVIPLYRYTVIPGFIDRLSRLFQQGELLSDQNKLITLKQGEWGYLANPKASYGYLYLDVYRCEGSLLLLICEEQKVQNHINVRYSLNF